ncbi:bifunctional adenosylcobinamide kinase/adenosylcobinamide-phosphate guanylyltransferase [Nocardia callitridis]|uniref:Adenosylcobinamide kinase n=1 Tax=Nocardia callitridis TaxID=648753 RepID=A0ABP9KGY1_9NOCA
MPTPRPPRTLVLGGARSGKSDYAEQLATAAKGAVHYLATAIPDPADTDFADRIAQHRRRRPAAWQVIESADPATVLRELADRDADTTTLLDDIGTWLTARIDARSAWEAPRGTITPDADSLVDAVANFPHRLVIVSPEVGMGVVPATRAGRLFRDEIGVVNQRLAQACDEAFLIVAGLALRLR